MRLKSHLLWFVLLLIASSCVSYEKFSMEVIKPPKLTLPTEIHKIAIVSRNLKYENDTLQNYQVKDHKLIKDKIRFNSDSLALITCIDSLASKLMAQNRFDSILIVPVSFFSEKRVKEIRPNKADWYKNLADKTGADGLILLDMFSCFYIQSTENNSTAKVITSNIWSFYDNNKQKITDRFVQIDTLIWDGMDEDGNSKKIRIPGKEAAKSMAAGVIGENYARHIQPTWTMVYRDIMSCSNPEFEKAAKLAQKNEWEEATSIWQKNVESKSKRNRIISLYNLALASEMNGDVDQALKLTSQAANASSGAFRSVENEAVRKYSAVLFQRRTEINKLSSQYEVPR
jgi:hypothetical protein